MIFESIEEIAAEAEARAFFYHKSQREGKIYLHRLTDTREGKSTHLLSLEYRFDTTGVDFFVYPPGSNAWLPPVTQKEGRPEQLRIDFFVNDFMVPLWGLLESLLKK